MPLQCPVYLFPEMYIVFLQPLVENPIEMYNSQKTDLSDWSVHLKLLPYNCVPWPTHRELLCSKPTTLVQVTTDQLPVCGAVQVMCAGSIVGLICGNREGM